MLNVAILSRGAGLYSTQSLFRAFRSREHYVRVIDHLRCNLVIEQGQPQVLYEGVPLLGMDVVVPRIGASATDYGVAVIRQFEQMGIYTATRSEALVLARDKLKCLQKLAAEGIAVPKTFAAGVIEDVPFILSKMDGMPIVIKLLESTHGVGVILAESTGAAIAMAEAFFKLNQPVLFQEFIAESNGADIRAFVVGKKVVASMKRQAPEGEFRSNLHRGAEPSVEELTEEEEAICVKSARLLGLNIAGVDLLRSNRGSLVMEVNASPGLEGIETTTGIDIAGDIAQHVEAGVAKFLNRKPGANTDHSF